ncbi:421_t:CDS:2, partial [Scutellospora calospora]
EKESMNTENIKTDLTLPEEIETKAKTMKKEGLELINKPKPKVSNDSDLPKTELTIQILIKENTKRSLIPKKGVKFIDNMKIHTSFILTLLLEVILP